jgi:ABC-2 type transport system permease protein
VNDLFPNAIHVARREYVTRVRGRAFVITTGLIALAVLVLTLLPTILAVVGVGEPPEIAVSVEAEDLSTDPVVALQALLIAAGNPGTPGEAAPTPAPSPRDASDGPRVHRADDPEAAARQVRAGELDGLLTITRADDGELQFEYLSDEGPTNQTRILVTQAATALTIGDRLERAGVSAGEGSEIFAPPSFTAVAADPNARDDEDFGGAFILAYAVVILTFMAILTYGNWVAQSVAEEKSSRVMELLITAATPRQLLTGKVLGTGAAGLSQYVVVVAALLIGFVAQAPLSSALGVGGSGLPFDLPSVGPGFVLAFALFFLLGFILYATLYAAAGSMVTRLEDIQQAVGPLIFLAMAGYFAAFAGLNDPSADWVRVVSLVPFFSPYLMPARMLLSSPSVTEVVLAIALLVATVAAALWIASRIYSAGVLLYGQRVGLRSVLRATRVAR